MSRSLVAEGSQHGGSCSNDHGRAVFWTSELHGDAYRMMSALHALELCTEAPLSAGFSNYHYVHVRSVYPCTGRNTVNDWDLAEWQKSVYSLRSYMHTRIFAWPKGENHAEF